MLGRRRRSLVSRHKVKDCAHLLQHLIALRQDLAILERDPCALILPIPTLDLLMDALLDFALEDAGSSRLIVVGDLEDVGSVDPVVGAAAHYMVARNIALVHGDLHPVSQLALKDRSI